MTRTQTSNNATRINPRYTGTPIDRIASERPRYGDECIDHSRMDGDGMPSHSRIRRVNVRATLILKFLIRLWELDSKSEIGMIAIHLQNSKWERAYKRDLRTG